MIAAILCAAGRGLRAGFSENKVLRELNGLPVLCHSLSAFAPLADEILVACAPEDMPRIFERGYTGLNGRTDKKASGLGLYLCRRICENLNHRIWAESCSGTTVYIDLRRRKLETE